MKFQNMKKTLMLGTGIGLISLGMNVAISNAQAEGFWDRTKNIFSAETLQNIIKDTTQDEDYFNGLSAGEVSEGLREALVVGTQNVVQRLGARDGFNANPNIRIPLPSPLKRVHTVLDKVGMGHMTDTLQTRLNRAAEAATPQAKALFITAIENMTIEDAKEILTGPDDAATSYLRNAMGPSLEAAMQPIIDQQLANVGALSSLKQVQTRYNQLPLMPPIDLDINEYVSQKALEGIFTYVAKEEAAIRNNPVDRTTELLKRVFSEQQ